MPDLKTAEWLIILATIAGPILAVQAQKFVERVRETRQRKLRLFYSLMATRAARVSPEHVQALNMIDLEFYGRTVFGVRLQNRKEKAVLESWRVYLDHLNQPFADDTLRMWSARGDELFSDLLYKMSLSLTYNFDQVQIKRGIYQPRAHGEQEYAQLAIRDNLAKILSGNQPLRVTLEARGTSQERLGSDTMPER